MRVACIVNPTAGWGRGARAGRLIAGILSELGLPYEIHETTYHGHGAVLARQLLDRGDVDCLVAVGGDGTFSQVAAEAVGSGVPVALVPGGSGNAMARALDLTIAPDGLRAAFANPARRRIDTATLNGRPFFAIAGVGFDAELVRSLRRSPLLPRTAGYVATGLTQLAKLRPFELRLDGEAVPVERCRALCLAICNGRYYGAGIPVAPAADLADGLLDFCLLADVPLPELPLVGAALLLGRHQKLTGVYSWQGRSLTVETVPPAPWHTDGEAGGLTPAVVEIRPASLDLVVLRVGRAGEGLAGPGPNRTLRP